jgi:large repetitive protein
MTSLSPRTGAPDGRIRRHMRRLAVITTAATAVVLGLATPAFAQYADVEVIKTVTAGSPDPARIGDTIGFTVLVRNNGPEPVPTVRLNDVTAPNVTWTCASTGGAVCPNASGTGDIDASAAMPNGSTFTYQLTWSVLAMPPTGRITNQASATSQGTGLIDNFPANNFSQAYVNVADMHTRKSVSPTHPAPGDTLTYRVVLTNNGLGDFAPATITDDLTDVLDDATFATVTATSGTAAFSSPNVTWSGTVPGGTMTGGVVTPGTVTITYTVVLKDPPPGDRILANAAVSGFGNCIAGSGDPDCSTEVRIPTAEITKTVTPTVAGPGDVVTYRITVTNTGPIAFAGATFSEDLTDVLDAATYNKDATATVGTVTYAKPTLTWVGDLPIEGTAVITFTATVLPVPGGDVKLTNQIRPGKSITCVVCTTEVPVPLLEVQKTSDAPAAVRGGDVVKYEFTITSVGTAPVTGATITDDLTDVLDDATFNNDAEASKGTVSYAEPVLRWSGDVALRGTVTVTYSVTVRANNPGNGQLPNTLVSPDTNCYKGSTDSRCTVKAVAPVLPVTGPSIMPIALAGGVLLLCGASTLFCTRRWSPRQHRAVQR